MTTSRPRRRRGRDARRSSATSASFSPRTSRAGLASPSSCRRSSTRLARLRSGSRSSASRDDEIVMPPRRGHRRARRPLLLPRRAHPAARGRGRQRAVEGDWPTRTRSSTATFVVIVDHPRVHRVLRADGSVLGLRHQPGLRDLSECCRRRHGQEVVRHSDLLGLREQGQRGRSSSASRSTTWRPFRRGPHPDRDRHRSSGRAARPACGRRTASPATSSSRWT